MLGDSVVRFKKDTTLILIDSLNYRLKGKPGEDFYKRLKDRAYRTKLTKELFDLLITSPREEILPSDTTSLFEIENPFSRYQGNIIDSIRIKQLEIFGPKFSDTTRQAKVIFEKIANKLHINTRERIIRNNLTIRQGETLDPQQMQDAERVIRELPFIQDARIVPMRADSSNTDFLLMTKDVFAFSFGGSINNRGGSLELDHKNLFGIGHELRNNFIWDNRFEQEFGYEIAYIMPNIRRSFITAEIGYYDTYFQQYQGVRLSRNFVTPQIKYAGGVHINQQTLREPFFLLSENRIDTVLSRFNEQDIWLARAFKLNFLEKEASDRTRLIIAARHLRYDYSERPPVTEDFNQFFQNRSLNLFSVGISTRRYYRDQLIFGFGRSEDIPYGHRVNFIYGYENNEFNNRYFASAQVAKGGFISNFGYLYADFTAEGFYRKGEQIEQGLVRGNALYFTNLFKVGSYRMRQFVSVNYTQGINRFGNEFLTINNGVDEGIRGFRSRDLRGTRRFSAQLETVAFSPSDLLGFRIAPYAFIDIGVLAERNQPILQGNAYQGIGLGFRIRNDNLTFNTFELRLSFYPDAPLDVNFFDFNVSGNSVRRFRDFDIIAPSPSVFR